MDPAINGSADWVGTLLSSAITGGTTFVVMWQWITAQKTTINHQISTIASKDTEIRELQTSRLNDSKEWAQNDRDTLEHVLSVIASVQTITDKLVDDLQGHHGELRVEVKECSEKVGLAVNGVTELLQRVR